MQRLIKDLLKYSRITAGTEPLVPTDCDAVLGEALDNLKVAIQETGATVNSGSLPTVQGDRTRLLQLLQNLIGNALKFRRQDEPSVIEVSAERDGELWRFTVSDNGIGVEPSARERIFEPFRRGCRRDDYPGTGIGLSICRKIVEHHGGTIWVEAADGPGATFCLTLRDAPPYHAPRSG